MLLLGREKDGPRRNVDLAVEKGEERERAMKRDDDRGVVVEMAQRWARDATGAAAATIEDCHEG